MDEFENLARVGYDAYGQSAEWKNYAGLPMPTWDEQSDTIRGHWRAAAEAIADKFAGTRWSVSTEANTTVGPGEIGESGERPAGG